MYAIIDTETTGLPQHDLARVIEVGVVIFDQDGVAVHTDEWLVTPGQLDEELYRRSFEVHQIPMELVSNEGISEEDAVHKLTAVLEDHGVRYVSSFNARFDKLMLERMGWSWGEWAPCIMEQAACHMGRGRRTVSLKHACAHYGVDKKFMELPTHRALPDAIRAAELATLVGVVPRRKAQ